jgi:rubredoxin
MVKNESYVVVSIDESNFHEANGVAPGQCFEVLKGEVEDVPPETRFVELAKETRTQETKAI